MTLAIVLLVAGLIVGGGIGYYMAPPKIETKTTTNTVTVKEVPLKATAVKLGWIASSTTGLETTKPLVDQIITVDMNAYAKKLGYDVSFVWQIDDAQGQAATHLEKVQALKAMSVTVFQGGGWSSMAAAALNYCNTNKMLMWSSSSTSPTLAIKDDYLYRLCPADSYLAPALAALVKSFGITQICFIQRGDSWGDGIKNLFEAEFKKVGGAFTGDTIRYATDSTEYSNYLATANKQLGEAIAKVGKAKVGGVLLAFDEATVIISQAKDYPNVYTTPWFGADGTAKSQRIVDDAGQGAISMKCYSLLAAASETVSFVDFNKRYFALTKQAAGSYTAYAYDIGTLIEQAMLEKQSQKAEDIIGLMSPIAARTFGVGGWCLLNEFGDRAPPPFDIWFYGIDPATKKPNYLNGGSYDILSGKFTFNEAALGFKPSG